MKTLTVATDYRLLDCGEGRRLERLGRYVIDRPAALAGLPARLPATTWQAADARYERDARGGRWTWRDGAPDEGWTVAIDGLTFELRPGSAGQVGVFPEQAPMWAWLAGQVERVAARQPEPPEVLDLFAFTGGASLAAARSGGRVSHVDASRTAVGWARRNAELSSLAERPIRWLIDDAEAFVRRELRRGRAYDGVILDPPSYGHGPGGRRAWHLRDQLADLLGLIARLVASRRGFVLLTAHTTEVGPDELRAVLVEAVERRCEAGPLGLVADSGARLPLGAFARIPAG